MEWLSRWIVLRWFGHVMQMSDNDFVERMYGGRIEAGSIEGRPSGTVDEYWKERPGRQGIKY